MTRLAPIRPDNLEPEMRAVFENASPRDRMMMTPTAHAPELMHALHNFADVLSDRGTIPGRLVELIRLRVAFHNQCRSCMAMRYQSGLDDGMTEGDVCSLETPQDAPDLTEAEKVAIAYADLSATNHFAITDETFAELRKHFTEPQIVELGLHIAYFVGFGRLVAAWDLVEELPESLADKSQPAAPWNAETFVVGR
ncbi:MAG: carboxymuconolactone decarboxylase family protein [Novosphingobium sp.]|nr:carboxymuconolactone decarboxylase family protein [Novosphingobium sp.]